MNGRTVGDKLRGLQDRRTVAAGLVGVGATTVAAGLWLATEGLPGSDGDKALPAPPEPGPRPVADNAAEAGGFADRDASFAADDKGSSPTALQTKLYSTPSEAARLTPVTVATVLTTDDPVLHLLRRTTFGLTPGLVDEARSTGIDGWLAAQLDPSAVGDDEADAVWARYPAASMNPAQIRDSYELYGWDAMFEYGKAVLGRQLWSHRQLYEVVVDFWGNHLNLPVPSGPAWDVGGPYHNDVIRKHALGSFTDMLLAAMRHPAMLRYLTNSTSTKEAVNENLGRELLELHTVGVGAGYSEEDVRSSAYILTGRMVSTDMASGVPSEFHYDPGRHWTGAVKVMDFRHDNASPEGGLDVGDAYLRYLASHPSTARTIASKLAVRFVSDVAPPTLVDRLAKAYLDNGTQILPMLDVLFRSGEFWAAVGQKTRRPLEDVVASARLLGLQPGDSAVAALDKFYWHVTQMGNAPLAWRAPNGYPDVQPAWRSTSSLLQSWNYHRDLLRGKVDGTSPPSVASLAEGQPQGSGAELVDSLSRRVCFQPLQPPHSTALVTFLSDLGDSRSDETLTELTALLLDSPYARLR
jgi:uncharacterized protein (DUF1800 family)